MNYLANRYPFSFLFSTIIGLLVIVWIMPGDPRPEEILARAVGFKAHASEACR